MSKVVVSLFLLFSSILFAHDYPSESQRKFTVLQPQAGTVLGLAKPPPAETKVYRWRREKDCEANGNDWRTEGNRVHHLFTGGVMFILKPESYLTVKQDFVVVREFIADFTQLERGANRVIEARGVMNNDLMILIRSSEPLSRVTCWEEGHIKQLPPRDAKLAPFSKREIELLLAPFRRDSVLEQEDLLIMEKLREEYGEDYVPLVDLEIDHLKSAAKEVAGNFDGKGLVSALWTAMEKGSFTSPVFHAVYGGYNPEKRREADEMNKQIRDLNRLGKEFGIGELFDIRRTDDREQSLDYNEASQYQFYRYYLTDPGRVLFKFLDAYRPHSFLGDDKDLLSGEKAVALHAEANDRTKTNGKGKTKIVLDRTKPPYNYDKWEVFELPIKYVTLNQSFRVMPGRSKACFVDGKEKADAEKVAPAYCCISLVDLPNDSGLIIDLMEPRVFAASKPIKTFEDEYGTAWLTLTGIQNFQSVSCTRKNEDKDRDGKVDPLPFLALFNQHFQDYATVVLKEPKRIGF